MMDAEKTEKTCSPCRGLALPTESFVLSALPQDVRVSCSMPSVKVLQMMQVACLAVGIGSGKWACFLQWTWIYHSAGGNLGFPMLSAELLGQLSCQTNRNLTEHTRACFKYRKHIDVKVLTYFRILEYVRSTIMWLDFHQAHPGSQNCQIFVPFETNWDAPFTRSLSLLWAFEKSKQLQRLFLASGTHTWSGMVSSCWALLQCYLRHSGIRFDFNVFCKVYHAVLQTHCSWLGDDTCLFLDRLFPGCTMPFNPMWLDCLDTIFLKNMLNLVAGLGKTVVLSWALQDKDR